MFKITEDTVVRPQKDGSGVVTVSGPGGSPWIVDPKKPWLGGNFDGGDLGSMYPNDLWPWLVESFGIKTMADVGCGTGETPRWFEGRGVKTIGVEGLEWNLARCKERCSARLIRHDFVTDGVCVIDPPVDLIWCADTVEHIDEAYVEDVIATLAQTTILAMCQGTDAHENVGWNHINNKPESYWIEKLASVGMIEDVELTAKSREIGNFGWWQATGHIYRKTTADITKARERALSARRDAPPTPAAAPDPFTHGQRAKWSAMADEPCLPRTVAHVQVTVDKMFRADELEVGDGFAVDSPFTPGRVVRPGDRLELSATNTSDKPRTLMAIWRGVTAG